LKSFRSSLQKRKLRQKTNPLSGSSLRHNSGTKGEK
jgi:hypothetical protein